MEHPKDHEPLTVCDERAAKLVLFVCIALPILFAVVWLLS